MQLLRKHTIEMVLIGLIVFPLIGYSNSLNRDSDPVVMSGVELRSLNRVAVDHIVGFRWQGSWEQIPIQIDERKYVDYAVIYGNAPSGQEFIAYTDPHTHVGPDIRPGFDANDELVFMTKDAGNLVPPSIACPEGVLADTQVQIEIYDPLDSSVAYVYLFESDGSLAQDADQDYVTYNFNLLSGPYMSTYIRGEGLNPEDSEIYTDAYQTHFSDRWIRDELQIFAGSATGVDILDRHKFGRDPGDCSRNENTASQGGGVFVTNKDGCIRAIRSYMGFNSAPYIQREHLFYERQQNICTYVRAHGTVSGVRDLYDYGPDAGGMFYFNDLNFDGVLVDGIPDEVTLGHINWEMITGLQGTLTVCHAFDTDFPGFDLVSFYGDDSTPELIQCTGDKYQYGTSGLSLDPIPFTDPVLYPTYYNSLALHRTDYYDDVSKDIDTAIMHHLQSNTPLEITVEPLNFVEWGIYVDDDAPHDPGPRDPNISDANETGSAEHPFDSLQKAINYAFDTDIITVLSGTYTGEGNREIDFRGKAITVRSQNGPQDCIIDCQGEGRGFVFQSNEGADSVLEGITIANGQAAHGGGMCLESSSPTLSNCIFRGNSASFQGGRTPNGPGGGIYCDRASRPSIAMCIFSGNSAVDYGGGIYSEHSNLTLTNCTFSDNSAGKLGGALYSNGGHPILSNCILWGDTPDEIQTNADTPIVTYSDIQGGFTGDGNIDVDPLFADPEKGDFHLKSQVGCWDLKNLIWILDDVTSPCIDAGDPQASVVDELEPNGERINMGAYGGTTEASLSRLGETR